MGVVFSTECVLERNFSKYVLETSLGRCNQTEAKLLCDNDYNDAKCVVSLADLKGWTDISCNETVVAFLCRVDCFDRIEDDENSDLIKIIGGAIAALVAIIILISLLLLIRKKTHDLKNAETGDLDKQRKVVDMLNNDGHSLPRNYGKLSSI